MVHSIKRVAVIGAGASGVSTTAHLKAAGLDVILFERTSTAGGVWVHDTRLSPEPAYPSLVASVAETNYYEDGEIPADQILEITHAPPGPCYELLQNNVPTAMMKLTLNSWPPGTEQIVRHHVLAEYIQDTAAKTGVNEVAQYNTRVEHVEKEENHWKVQTSTLEPGTSEKVNKDWEFDAVIVASGHYHAPKVPAIPGLREWKDAYPSRVSHSKRYRSARGYENQTVLLIGGSTSSVDIAKELAGIAKRSYQSTRNGAFDHPSGMLPSNANRVAEVAFFSLDYQETKAPDAPIPGTATLVDGTVLTGIDRVVVATGYHCTYPFLKQYHNDALKPQEADDKILVTNGLQIHNLHKDIFYIPDPTLAFIGVPYYTATFSLFEFQAQSVTAVFSGRAPLPTEAEQREEYNKRVEAKGYGRTFHSLRGKDAEYADELRAWINPGIVAAGGKPVEPHTKEWHEQFKLLMARFKTLGLNFQFEPKGERIKDNVQILAEAVEAVEVR